MAKINSFTMCRTPRGFAGCELSHSPRLRSFNKIIFEPSYHNWNTGVVKLIYKRISQKNVLGKKRPLIFSQVHF